MRTRVTFDIEIRHTPSTHGPNRQESKEEGERMAGKTIERRADWSDWWPELLPGPSRRAVRLATVEHAPRSRAHAPRRGVRGQRQSRHSRRDAGIDPDKDVEIHLRNHTLEIRAERKEEETHEEKGRLPQRVPVRNVLPGAR